MRARFSSRYPVSTERVSGALSAVSLYDALKRAADAQHLAEYGERDEDRSEREALRGVTRALNRTIGNVGCSADFCSPAYVLSDLTRAEFTRFGGPVFDEGMVILFEEEDEGEYSLFVYRLDRSGNLAVEPFAHGRVQDGTLAAALGNLQQSGTRPGGRRRSRRAR